MDENTTLPRRSLAVSGSASVAVKPDICYMNFTIETENKNVARAYRENKNAADHLFSKLKKIEIEERDLRTTYFYVMPYYKIEDDSSKQVIDGYRIFHYLLVTVRNLEQVSDTLDTAISSGATGVSSMNFTVENPQKYTEEIRKEALKAALRKAEETAQIMGFKLGTPISITESQPGRNSQPYQQNSRLTTIAPQQQSQKPQLEPGELSLTSKVYVTYEIEPQ